MRIETSAYVASRPGHGLCLGTAETETSPLRRLGFGLFFRFSGPYVHRLTRIDVVRRLGVCGGFREAAVFGTCSGMWDTAGTSEVFARRPTALSGCSRR